MPNSSHTRSTPDNPVVGLRLSQAKFRSIVEASPMSIHTYHLDSDGQLIFSGANPAADRTLGIEHAELIGQTIEQAFPALVNTEIPKRYRDVIESGKTWFSEQIEYQDARIKGAFEVHAFRISSDSLAVMFLEITRRKQTEQALQESETRFKALFERAPDGYYLSDLNGVFIDGNRKAEEMIGYKREELIGKNFLELDLLPMDQLQLAAEMLERNKQGFTTGPEELVLRHKLGRKVHIEITSLPIELKGAKTVLGIARDITERKKAEKTQMQLQAQLQLAQKMEALGSLAGGIAHDFNNILSAIIGYTEIALVDVVDNPELQENLEKVRQAGNRAKELVKQILTFSRQSEIESKPVKVRLVVKEALKLLRPTLPATIEIHEHIDSEAAVMADPIQIHQVMMNLCTNAAHAMAAEGGILSVSLRDTHVDEPLAGKYPGLKAGRYVKLEIKDTGYGIAPELIDRVFDPFFTTKKKGEGTGMGLAMVHGIVKSHDGTVTVNSRPGEGSAFAIYLPCIDDQPQAPTTQRMTLPKGTETILLVDDEPFQVDIGTQMLNRLGYRVVALTDPQEALARFQQAPETIDLVISDMTMPQMTGDVLARALKAVRADIPIIICTGYSERINQESVRSMGIAGLAMKPVVMKDIAHLIRKILDES